MHRLRFLSLLLSAGLLATAADLPSGDSLMQKATDATGTKEALEKAKTIVMAGTVSIEGRNINGPVNVWQEDGKSYTAIEFPGIGKVEEGFDGNIAWEMNALQGARIKTGSERAAAIRSGKMNMLASWREEYKSVQTVGEADVNGKPAWKVELVPNEGKVETFYLDKATGLPVRIAQTVVSPLGEVQVEMNISDYREVNGIKTPFTMTQNAVGQVMVMKFSKISYGTPIPADRFELPAAVKALAAKK
ncbi:MAG: hypothetical protein JWN34_3657 [Bryobacterales bacterium]|nr:hypothetical protein [Bryobacterales bacterium]